MYCGSEESPNTDKLYRRQFVLKESVTQNQHTDSEAFDSRLYDTVLVHMRNKHETNAVNTRVLCLEGSEWKALIPETTLTAGSELYETLRGRFELVKVQIKSSRTDKEGIINAVIDGISQ